MPWSFRVRLSFWGAVDSDNDLNSSLASDRESPGDQIDTATTTTGQQWLGATTVNVMFAVLSQTVTTPTPSRPQNPIPGQKDLPSLVSQARDIIKNATGDCAKLLGRDALSRFDARSGNIQFNGDILVHVEGLDGGVREGRLSDVPPTSAVTVGDQIYLNPSGWAFQSFSNFPKLTEYFGKVGAADQHQYALATILHEFLHTTGRFKPDSVIGLDGKINSKQSEKYQKEVLKKCFTNK